jgi:hypothetical protein
MNTADLLEEFTLLMNRYGVNSIQVRQFYQANRYNKKFRTLAGTARLVKVALQSKRAGDN